jgi:hypothetical protein
LPRCNPWPWFRMASMLIAKWTSLTHLTMANLLWRLNRSTWLSMSCIQWSFTVSASELLLATSKHVLASRKHRISNFCTWASALFNAHFGAKIGLCETFTPLNFQPFVFSKLWRLIHCQCTSIPSVGNKIIYTILYSLNSVRNHNKIFYFI